MEPETVKLKCAFCGKGIKPPEEYRKDYTLYAWCNDPEDPTSFNKVAKVAHIECFETFKTLNRLTAY